MGRHHNRILVLVKEIRSEPRPEFLCALFVETHAVTPITSQRHLVRCLRSHRLVSRAAVESLIGA
jgi:hypothetical protein